MKPLRLGAGSRIDSHGVEKDSLPKIIFEDQADTTQPSQSIELVDGALHVFNDPEGPNRTDLGTIPGSGGGGGGQVDEVIAGPGIAVDNTDPENPEVSVMISTDSDNALTRGTDDGLMLDPDDLVSSDPGNALSIGTDGKLVATGGGGASSSIVIIRDLTDVDGGVLSTTRDSFRMPLNFNLDGVRASVDVTSTSADIVFDIKCDGVSIFDTDMLQIDEGDFSSKASATPPVIDTDFFPDDALIEIITVNEGTDAAGARVYFVGTEGGDPIEITGSLSAWAVGVPVSDVLVVVGGSGVYTGMTLVNGAWPAGVSASLVGDEIQLSGTPTTAGAWSAEPEVTDSDSATGSRGLSGNVLSGWAEFDPLYKSPPAIVSGVSLKRTAGGGTSGNSRATAPITGKRYFSIFVDYHGTGSVVGMGIADELANLTPSASWLGNVALSSAVWGPATGGRYINGVYVGPAGALSNVLEIAVDSATRSAWVRNPGFAWIGGGDPSAGTSPTLTVGGSGGLYFSASLWEGTNDYLREVVLHSNPVDVSGTPPAGFSTGIPG